MRKKDLYRYVYPICNEKNDEIFKKTCLLIENGLGGLKKETAFPLLDLGMIQIYYYGERKIAVYNDGCIEAVCVCSDTDIGHILGVESIY